MELLLAPENQAFAVALAVMVGIGALEGALTLLGMGASHLLDQLLPNGFDADIDGPEMAEPGLLSGLLSWMYFGKAPALVLLVGFLMCFGLGGLILQGFVRFAGGGFLPGWLAVVPALAVAIPGTRGFGAAVARFLPRDETTAVSEDDFVGTVATLILGEAAAGEPAQARLTDRHGQTHYIMVEPDATDDRFGAGDAVLLVSRAGATFKAIRNPSATLAPDRS